jgi:creatinine amidohydrolase
METRWLYTTSENFPALVEASKGVCVIPMGCVEKHGLHLPLGTDIFEASEIGYLASQLETACMFPDFTFGDVSCNAPVQPNGFMPAGSITLSVETEMLLLEELCEQASRNGFKKILIANGHGGNTPWLSTFLRKLYNRKHDFVCAVYAMGSSKSPYFMADILQREGSGALPYLTKEDEQLILDFCAKKKEVGHACMGETSCIMGLHPETVHLDRLGIESGLSTHETDYLKDVGIQIMNGGWDINYPNAYHGHDPIGCNERIGKAAVHVQSHRLAKALKVLKEDENILRWHHEMQKGW